MPNMKAAEKWARQTEKREERNKVAKSRLKTLFKKALSGEQSGPEVASAFDRAAGKGIIHPNKAARKKARLARALAKVATTPAKAKAPKARAKSAKAPARAKKSPAKR